jgi:hypothetical protein
MCAAYVCVHMYLIRMFCAYRADLLALKAEMARAKEEANALAIQV